MSEPVYADANDSDAGAREFLLELGRTMAGDLAGGRLAESILWKREAARQSASQRQEDEPVYHPARHGGRRVLAVLSHPQSPADLYELEPAGSGFFAEGQRGHPGPVLHSHQFDRGALAALGWQVKEMDGQ